MKNLDATLAEFPKLDYMFGFDERHVRHFTFSFIKGEECWEWSESLNKDGYGRYTLRGFTWLAHRLAWTLTYGDIPEDICVLHGCDNPKCVRPDHLHLGTRLENNKEMALRGRAAKGNKHHNAVLTEEIVRLIRSSRSQGVSDKALSEALNIPVGTIWCARTGKTWKHVK